jgi:hypothetical protein
LSYYRYKNRLKKNQFEFLRSILMYLRRKIMNKSAGKSKKFSMTFVFVFMHTVLLSSVTIGQQTDTFPRAGGQDKYETALEASKLWDSSESIVIVSDNDYLYNMPAASLAGVLTAPVLYLPEGVGTPEQGLIINNVIDEVNRLGASDIYILGSEQAEAGRVFEQRVTANKQNKNVTTIYASENDYYTFAKDVASLVFNISRQTSALLVRSSVPDDLIANAGLSATGGRPVLYSDGASLNSTTEKAIIDLSISNIEYNHTDLHRPSLTNRLRQLINNVREEHSLITSSDIAYSIANRQNRKGVVIVSEEIYNDVLVAAALANKMNYGLLLVSRNVLPAGTRSFFEHQSPGYNIITVGGPDAISKKVFNEIDTALAMDDPWPFQRGYDARRQEIVRQDYLPLMREELERPRIWLRDGELDRIKSNIGRDPFVAQAYTTAKDFAYDWDGEATYRNPWSAGHILQQLMLVYMVEGKPQDILWDRVNANIDAIMEFNEFSVEMQWAGVQNAMALGIAFDWLYDELTAERRLDIAERILDFAKIANTRWRHTTYSNQYYKHYNMVLFSGLALLDEGIDDARAERLVIEGTEAVLFEGIPSKNQVGAGEGGWHESMGYHQFHNWLFTQSLDMVVEATGVDLWEDFYGNDGNPEWYWYNMRPHDGQFVEIANINLGNARLNRENLGDLVIQQARKQDPVATALIQKYFEEPQSKYSTGIWPGFWYPMIIWYDPDVEPAVLNELPLSRFFSGVGWSSMRSSWEEDATFAVFNSGNQYNGHAQADANSFVIHKMGPLATDVGQRSAKNSRFHNMVNIGDGQWITNNDTQQFYIPDIEGSTLEAGKIISYTDNDYYTYSTGDATAAYQHTSTKVIEDTRHFLYLKPDTFVVFDRIITENADTPKEWLLHGAVPAQKVSSNEYVLHDANEDPVGQLHTELLLPANPVIEQKDITGGDRGNTSYYVQVSSGMEQTTEFFLNVLTADKYGQEYPQASDMVETDESVTLTLSREGLAYEVTFMKNTQLGGQIRITTDDGQLLFEDDLPLDIIR